MFYKLYYSGWDDEGLIPKTIQTFAQFAVSCGTMCVCVYKYIYIYIYKCLFIDIYIFIYWGVTIQNDQTFQVEEYDQSPRSMP